MERSRVRGGDIYLCEFSKMSGGDDLVYYGFMDLNLQRVVEIFDHYHKGNN